MSVHKRSSPPAPLTVGVEEEFLLVDPRSRMPIPVAQQVASHLPADLIHRSRDEFRLTMLEMVTPVCTGLADLDRHLRTARRAAAAAAMAAGARLVSAGIAPTHDPIRHNTPSERYQEIVTRFGAITQDPTVCGVHVHVGVPDREIAVAVSNHLRPWLPVIQAIGANSPLHAGADTGHASWRSVQLGRWPSLGPTPYFGSVAEHDDAVAGLIATGAILDEAMVYWLARISTKYPTIEIRVADACTTVAESVLIAALTRGLVATAIDDVRRGVPALRVSECVLAAAHWRAAHDGLEGTLVDLRHGRQTPAWELVNTLLAKVRPALDAHDDTVTVETLVTDLKRMGSGAARQRAVFARTGDARAVTDHLIGETVDPHRPTLVSTAQP